MLTVLATNHEASVAYTTMYGDMCGD